MLNYVRHYIGQEPKNAQPIIVTFNPWWFSGQENLARAFMSQLRAVLPAKNAKLKKLGTLIGEYAESIGGFADLTGKTLGAGRAVGKVISQDTALLTRDDIQKLQTSWLEGIRASKASLLTHSHLPHLLTAWKEWGDLTEVKAWCDRATASNDGLFRFLSKFLWRKKSQTFGDWAVRETPRLDPESLKPFLDVGACAKRLAALRDARKVPKSATKAVSRFIKEFELRKLGQNPDIEEDNEGV